jgi:flagellar motility protein MotE (MotC chaperone)
MKALSSPLVVILLSVLLSVVPMLYMLTTASTALVGNIAVQKEAEHEASRPPKPWDFWTPELENLAHELTETKAGFASREADLAAREKRLAAEAKELDQIRQQIESLRGEIAGRITEVKAQEMVNLKTLATTYSKITPSAAVAIFSQMDVPSITKILSLMKADVNSAILQEMGRVPGPDNVNAKRAADISQRLRMLQPVKLPAS